ERASHLLDPPLVQDHDSIGEGHRLDLVVGHVDHGRSELILQAGNLEPGLDPQRGVEVRERLVEKEHLRLARDGAADRHPLPLAARKGAGLAVPEVMSSSAAMRRSSVDFPQPDGPTKTTKSPWAMSRSTSRITMMSPNAFPTFFSTTSATDASSNLSLPRR